MKTSKLIGNCNHIINWNSIIKDLLSQTASTIGPTIRKKSKGKYIPEITSNEEHLIKTKQIWKESGYRSVTEGGSAEWHMYFPGLNFDQCVIDKFVDFYEIETYHDSWISMIMPGRCAPWHIDQYKEKNNIQRYHCHIGEAETGHVFMIQNDYYVNIKQGSTYQWNNIFYWHAGFNAGERPKFLLNLY